MKRIDSANAQADKFGPGKNGFQGGNPSLNLDATYFTPDWCDHVQEEIANAIESFNVVLDGTKRTQLAAVLQAIKDGSQLAAGIFIDAAWIIPPAGLRVLRTNGQAVSVATYSALLSIYCGDARNGDAQWGYRCTDPANPSTTRSTTGGYIVLPKTRGRYARDLGDGTGIADGMDLYTYYADELRAHNHPYQWFPGDGSGEYDSDWQAGHSQQTGWTGLTGGAETRPFTYFCTRWITY